jgi:3-methylcrotonyl-CoA carboxylase alpha subunit
MKRLTFLYGERWIELQVLPEGKGWRVILPDGSQHQVSEVHIEEDGSLQLRTATGVWRLFFQRSGNEITLSYQGRVYPFHSAASGAATAHHPTAEGMLSAPMPGLIRKVLVQAGEQVEAGQPLIVLEAMKTEQTLRAPYAGVVRTLSCREGEIVQEGSILIEIE